MENYNFKNNSQENISETKEKAIEFSNSFLQKQEQFLLEIHEIIQGNDTLRKGIQEYGDMEEIFTSFKLFYRPGALNYIGIDFKGSIDANPTYTPQLHVIEDIAKELNNRMHLIKEELLGFTGNHDDALSLLQKIHKEKMIPALNSQDDPILR